MSNTKIDIVGIGNAIVDIIISCQEEYLKRLHLIKNSMSLIDLKTANTLYNAINSNSVIEISGGSAANTISGIASLGGKCAFFGKIGNDYLGKIFCHSMNKMGIYFDPNLLCIEKSTARCLIFVTPDGQRTMNTFLGACTKLGPQDINEELIKSAKIIYMEGYLWDAPNSQSAFIKAAKIAHQFGGKVSMNLSDSSCVKRYRKSFYDFIEHHIDIIFGNESEIKSLYKVNNFKEAIEKVRHHCKLSVLTRSEKGAVIISENDIYEISAYPVEKVIDTTGAGDLFASGFLYGYIKGYDIPLCGKIASICAGLVISHMGARSNINLKTLLESINIKL